MVARPKKSKGYIVRIILVCLLGSLLSLMLHELFHVIMHWGHITHVYFFPTPWTLMEVAADLPPGYDIDGEEMIAYMITFTVMIITVLVAFKIQDDNDKRDPGQILFPDDPEMQKLSPDELWKQSGMEYILPENPKKKTRPTSRLKRPKKS